jgi:hypothetical protein
MKKAKLNKNRLRGKSHPLQRGKMPNIPVNFMLGVIASMFTVEALRNGKSITVTFGDDEDSGVPYDKNDYPDGTNLEGLEK